MGKLIHKMRVPEIFPGVVTVQPPQSTLKHQEKPFFFTLRRKQGMVQLSIAGAWGIRHSLSSIAESLVAVFAGCLPTSSRLSPQKEKNEKRNKMTPPKSST